MDTIFSNNLSLSWNYRFVNINQAFTNIHQTWKDLLVVSDKVVNLQHCLSKYYYKYWFHIQRNISGFRSKNNKGLKVWWHDAVNCINVRYTKWNRKSIILKKLQTYTFKNAYRSNYEIIQFKNNIYIVLFYLLVIRYTILRAI